METPSRVPTNLSAAPCVLRCRLRVLAAVCTASLAVMQGFIVASANCPPSGVNNSTGYFYSGLTPASANWGGIATDISKTGLGVPSGLANSHILVYVAACTERCFGMASYDDCLNGNLDMCFIQVGYGLGHLPNKNSESVPDLYLEYNDIFQYSDSWYSNAAFPLSQNNFYTVWKSGTQCFNGVGNLWNAYYSQDPTGSSGTHLLGQACLANQTPQVGAFTELWQNNASNYNCPTIAPYQYFATDGSGKPTFNIVFNGTTWQNIANLINNNWPPNLPSGFNGVWDANYWAWHIWGSSP